MFGLDRSCNGFVRSGVVLSGFDVSCTGLFCLVWFGMGKVELF